MYLGARVGGNIRLVVARPYSNIFYLTWRFSQGVDTLPTCIQSHAKVATSCADPRIFIRGVPAGPSVLKL